MTNSAGSPGGHDYLDKAINIAVHLAVIAFILYVSAKILSPFVMPVVWGIIIAVALQPAFEKMKSMLGGRRKLAGALFILLGLAIVILPTIWLADSLFEGTKEIGQQLEDGTFKVPPPSESVKDWPLIGDETYRIWYGASVNLEGTAEKLAPQLKAIGAKFASAVAGVGAAIIQSILSLIIAGILLIHTEGAGGAARAIGRRLGGDDGVAMVDISTATVRSVVKGVLLVALIQSLLAAVGLVIASVPAAGLWALIVLMLAIMQLPPILILGPIAIWVFSANDSTAIAVFFLIWSLVVSGADGPLKAVLLGRGVQVPMIVILIGAIGGMLSAGIIGLFVGAVILSIGYQLVTAWMREASEEAAANEAETPNV
ncbi:MAG: AI-2E family transporter [Candidatus Latescibacterota bacterium]|nr:MAG: AI-2E family transporter [Candidatus Latescibacterota bacterium]